MVKYALALIVTVASMGIATAAKSAGYLGAHVGYGSAKSKITYDPARAGSVNVDNDAPNLGALAGYGATYGIWYVGAEIFYTLETLKIQDTTQAALNGLMMELSRKHYYGAALRFGFWMQAQTLAYFRLGAHGGKWKLSDTRVNNGVGDTLFEKNRFTLAPGLGVEMTLHKNLALRTEWFYEFGPAIVATNSANRALFTRSSSVLYQSFRLGLTYRF
jgi:opacity protein-like surface antigen